MTYKVELSFAGMRLSEPVSDKDLEIRSARLFGEMELPAGAADSDPRWQHGYADGEEEKNPASADPVYVSGWCHGFCGANQTSDVEAVEAYHSRLKPAMA